MGNLIAAISSSNLFTSGTNTPKSIDWKPAYFISWDRVSKLYSLGVLGKGQ